METITKIEDYRKCLNEVRTTGKAITVKNNMPIEESEKLTDEDVQGLDIVIKEEGDEIIPLTKEYIEKSQKEFEENFKMPLDKLTYPRVKKK